MSRNSGVVGLDEITGPWNVVSQMHMRSLLRTGPPKTSFVPNWIVPQVESLRAGLP